LSSEDGDQQAAGFVCASCFPLNVFRLNES
jgi:hypothetical protein